MGMMFRAVGLMPSTHKHWWDKWVQYGGGYADLEWCKREAKGMAELPIYYR